MRRLFGSKFVFSLLTLAAALPVHSAHACAMCYNSNVGDSPLANGMNWGIFSLLGVVVFVLGSIATVAIYLARKSAALAAQGEALAVTPATQKA